MVRRLLIGLALGVAGALAAFLLGRLPFVQTLEWKMYDQRVRWTAEPAKASRDIVLVTIDEKSVRELAPIFGRWPWPRALHAQLIDFLGRAPARVVAYDVLFTEADERLAFMVGETRWSGKESDEAFAASVKAARNVVLAADATFEGLQGSEKQPRAPAPHAFDRVRLDDSFEHRPVITPPFGELDRAALGLGHNLFVLDADGPVRRAVPFVRFGDRVLPSLGLAAVMFARGLAASDVALRGDVLQVGATALPLTLEEVPRFAGEAGMPATSRRALIAFRGPAVLPDGETSLYKQYSFSDVVASQFAVLDGATPVIPPETFKDKIVFVGLTAAGLHDVWAVPFGDTGKMPGPMIHAAFADQVLGGRSIARVSPAAETAVAVLVALFCGVLMLTVRQRIAWPVVALGLGGLIWGSVRWFAAGTWLPTTHPLIGGALATVGGLAYQYFVEGREKRAVKKLFSRYLSRDVYEQVLAHPELAELGGKRRDMSVLFSDIRGFTAMTEKGDPELLVAQLNEYFSRMVDIVFAHRGTLDKFVGDMVMALFGAPLEDDRHADHAVEAALAMVRELRVLNERWAAEGRPTLGIGIGINSGEMIAGNIGAESIRSYTVIGDNVNLGSRLESLNKDYKTEIIISSYTASRLSRPFDLHPLGTVVVKGKTQSVEIFEVRSGPSPA